MADDLTGELSRIDRARLTGPALRSFFAIAKAWGLTADEQMRLLGLSSRSTLTRWRHGGIAAAQSDTLERVSCILGIYRAVGTLLPQPGHAHAWIRRPNRAPLFSGGSALDRMLTGNVDDLRAVRRYLEGQVG